MPAIVTLTMNPAVDISTTAERVRTTDKVRCGEPCYDPGGGGINVARIVRGSVLSIKEADYIKSAVALGFSTPRILFQHILPDAVAPILVNATFNIANAIIVEASLSFLGLGVQPPTASWGNMLTDAQTLSVLTDKPWLWIPPGIMIIISVLSVNFIGDGLRDALDPRSLK